MGEILFKGQLFTIELETDSRGNSRETCSRPPSVSVIAITSGKRIILVNEKRPLYDGRIYALPSGRADKEDDPMVGAQRELQEEAGVKAGSLELFMKSEPSNNLRYDRYVYIARDLEVSRLPQDPDEDIVVVFKTLEQAALLALEGRIRPEIAALAVLRFKYAVDSGRIKL